MRKKTQKKKRPKTAENAEISAQNANISAILETEHTDMPSEPTKPDALGNDIPSIQIFEYNPSYCQERSVQNLSDCFPLKDSAITWINIDGIQNHEVIQQIGNTFHLHQLTMEDIANTKQWPRVEIFDHYIFLVLKMLYYNADDDKTICSEHVSLILGTNFLVSFQENPGDVFGHIRKNIRVEKSTVRKNGADYLAYALMDAIVDNYFSVLGKTGDDVDGLEENMVKHPNQRSLQVLHSLKTELLSLRKSVRPLRDVVYKLDREDSPLIRNSTHVYLRDLYEHTIQVIETAEIYRETLSGMLDIFLSSASNRTNEIIKVLTVISTIFIPLTFVAGVYGMNFDNMPELKWHWGYFGLWAIMVTLALIMLVCFRKRKWI